MGSHSSRIEITNVVKRYQRAGGKVITPVDGISLSVNREELVVLLGPSGCGKTTLLRCVAGLERPDEGEIVVEGKVVFSSKRNIFIPPDQRNLSMIFQSYALWPHMTVAKNVGYPLIGRNLSTAAIHERVSAALRKVGIGGLEDQYPSRISGGQQQRVALARALVSNPNVVLFDEPLSNVDAQVRGQLRFELKRMQKEVGYSGLYVTHDQAEAMELGHRVAVLESGRIAALDSPQRVYENPSSRYVADFVGIANLIQGKVRKSSGQILAVETEIGPISVKPTSRTFALGEDVLLVVRPEKMRLQVDRPPNGDNAFHVRMSERLFSGPHTEFVVSRDRTMMRIWSNDDALALLCEGDDAWVSFDAANVSVIPSKATDHADI
jgi:iron(III) transport system ATP-binding protein